MSYQVFIPKSVQKEFDKLPKSDYEKVYIKIQALTEEPRPSGVVKMEGFDNEYRIRIGDYRVRYQVNDKDLILLVVHCKHRKDVYRN